MGHDIASRDPWRGANWREFWKTSMERDRFDAAMREYERPIAKRFKRHKPRFEDFVDDE